MASSNEQKPLAAKKAMPLKSVLLLAMLTAMSLGLAAAEALLPPLLFLPGVKLGLPNIVTLTALAFLEKKQVFLVVVMRLLLAGLALGTFLTPAFWISCGGGALSFLIMAILAGRQSVSVVGVSLGGAAAHHGGQLLTVALLLGNTGAFYYLPWLLLCSIPVGLFTGFSAKSAIQALRRSGINDIM
jgi:heptaprenyl diphosphate synthase